MEDVPIKVYEYLQDLKDKRKKKRLDRIVEQVEDKLYERKARVRKEHAAKESQLKRLEPKQDQRGQYKKFP